MMPYRVNCSTAKKNPSKYYERVICNCFGRKGQPQVLVFTKAEFEQHKKEMKEIEKDE